MRAGQFVRYAGEHVTREANWTAFVHATGMPNYSALVARSSSDSHWFCNERIAFSISVIGCTTRCCDLSRGLPFAEWCIGSNVDLVLNTLNKKTAAERGTLPV
jgi:acetyl-CoA synthetase